MSIKNWFKLRKYISWREYNNRVEALEDFNFWASAIGCEVQKK